MHAASITIGISTVEENLNELTIPKTDADIVYLIVIQHKNDFKYNKIPAQLSRRLDVNIILSQERGLSKSRNIIIRNARTKYIHFMDDDVRIDTDGVKSLASQMRMHKGDIITGTYTTLSGSPPKNYKKHIFQHNILSAAQVSSIEICVDRESIFNNGIFFDINFGLGTSLPSGEEYLLLADALRKNLLVLFSPTSVGVHPDITSGDDFYSSAAKVRAKKEMIRRVFGTYFPIVSFLFWAKKISKVKTFKQAYLFTIIMLGY